MKTWIQLKLSEEIHFWNSGGTWGHAEDRAQLQHGRLPWDSGIRHTCCFLLVHRVFTCFSYSFIFVHTDLRSASTFYPRWTVNIMWDTATIWKTHSVQLVVSCRFRQYCSSKTKDIFWSLQTKRLGPKVQSNITFVVSAAQNINQNLSHKVQTFKVGSNKKQVLPMFTCLHLKAAQQMLCRQSCSRGLTKHPPDLDNVSYLSISSNLSLKWNNLWCI